MQPNRLTKIMVLLHNRQRGNYHSFVAECDRDVGTWLHIPRFFSKNGQFLGANPKIPKILTSQFFDSFRLILQGSTLVSLKILLIAATPFESDSVREHFSMHLEERGSVGIDSKSGNRITLLHTGIGMVNTAWHLGRELQRERPDIAIQFGIAGAFEGGPALVEVVELQQDCFAELGAESPSGFLPLETLGFANFRLGNQPFYNVLRQPALPLEGLRQCRAISVNRISGTEEGIRRMEQIWNPEVETMEGAAFFQGCLIENVPFRALRAISNRVEPRNREAWKLKEAVEAVQKELLFRLQRLETGEAL